MSNRAQGAIILKTRFEDLIKFIEAANEQVLAGKIIELKDLDKTVGALCSDVEKAPPETAKEMQPLMAEMISKLDELAQNLTDFQNRNKPS